MADLIVIGGGLAGSEAAWQAAERGLKVHLYEMRPGRSTGAHIGGDLGELVCSNSLGSILPDRASGVLKNELRRMGSLLLHLAEEAAVPAGGALAVDREDFSAKVTQALSSHKNITLVREECTRIPPGLAIIASGPLTSPSLSRSIVELTGRDHLYFYDAIAPTISLDSVDMSIVYRASRYGRGSQNDGDYLNCPLTKEQYLVLVEALLNSERISLREFELELESGVKAGVHKYFEGCLPVEVIASRGIQALAFGPLRPVGLNDPKTGRHPYGVVQLRQDNLAGTLYNMVGFQTNLTFSDQRRVFRLIPGLEGAEFVRFGQMHRNTFIYSPAHLLTTLQFRTRENLFFAGQITGVEGYIGNIATGLLAGWNASRLHQGLAPVALPETTVLGALCRYITLASAADFQPMKPNFGILPVLEDPPQGKRERAAAYAKRGLENLDTFLKSCSDVVKI